MNVLFLVSEAYPLAKTGGLGDMAGSLPVALHRQGLDVRLMLPGYPDVRDRTADHAAPIDMGDPFGVGTVRILPARIAQNDLPVYIVDCPPLFERPGGLYEETPGVGWADNHIRFALFNRVAAEFCLTQPDGFLPDILHGHDWQAGMAAAYMAFSGVPHGTRKVFTIHNIQYQGIFGPEILGDIGLPPESFSIGGVEFYGQVSFLKSGIYFADLITTVSPTYAQEIRGPEGAWGLDGLLNARAPQLEGILNGIDTDIWNPAADPLLPAVFHADDLVGKAHCKMELQKELGLDIEPHTPLLGTVTRLTDQKGADLILDSLDRMVDMGAQIAILGAGEPWFNEAYRDRIGSRPGRLAIQVGYDEALSHRIQAGADAFLIPSRSEPCGLTQMYAMRYGTLPIARRVGGLADTVKDIGFADGNGFQFTHLTADEVSFAAWRAVEAYMKAPGRWRMAQRQGMLTDFSWDNAARRYIELYRRLV